MVMFETSRVLAKTGLVKRTDVCVPKSAACRNDSESHTSMYIALLCWPQSCDFFQPTEIQPAARSV